MVNETVRKALLDAKEVLTRYKDRSALLETTNGYVVRCGLVYMSFDDSGSPYASSVDKCSMFVNEKDAQRLAAGIANGHGQRGEALPIGTALNEMIANIDEALTLVL